MMEEDGKLEDGPFMDLIFLTFSDELSTETNSKAMAHKITSREATLLELVTGLGPKLTSSSVPDRVKATEILAHVFSSFPSDFLSEKELEFIVDFLINRLKDQHLVIPKTILCIHPIVQCKNLPKGSGARLLHQIFQEANVQSHMHRIRRTVFLIIEFLLSKKLDELKELSSDFVINFLQAIDGEKDPRNLLLLFQMIPVILSNFNLGPFIEDFFEVLACYFPIDFSPTVGIPGETITRELLAEALHVCLSHTNQFSEFLIPLALEKLDSSLNDAKIDALRLLELCCERCYEPENLQPFLSQFWHSLRREIFMGGNEMVEAQSISFLQATFNVLSRNEGIFKTCIEMIFTECKHHLSEPELRLINPTSKILSGMCSASQKSCEMVAPQILSTLIDQLTKKTVQGERKRIMEITEQILVTCRQYPEVSLKKLIGSWDDMIVTWFSFLTNDDPDFGNLSLKILLQCLRNESDFPENHRKLLQIHILAMVEKGSLSQATLVTIINVAEILVSKHGSEFAELSVPKLLAAISSSTENNESESDSGKLFVVGKGLISSTILAECSLNNETVYEKVISHLLTEIHGHTSSINIRALQCLNRTVEKVSQMEESRSSTFIAILVEKLSVFDQIFTVSIRNFNFKTDCDATETVNAVNALKDSDVFRMSVTIMRNIMRSASPDIQNKLTIRFWKDVVQDKNWDDCFQEFPLAVVEALLGSLWPSVQIHRGKEFSEYLLQNSFKVSSNESSYQRLLSAFLNKLEPESEFLEFLKFVEERIDSSFITQGCNDSDQMEVDSPESGNEKIQNSIHLLAWITKGLAMRGIRELTKWVEKLIKILSFDVVGMVAAEGFNILLADDLTTLNPQSHCNFRFLYKQRIFQMSVPRLVAGYQAAESNSTKANFIWALSSQLKYIRKEVLGMEIENVFPLLVASLKLNSHSSPIVRSTLKAFTEMLQNSDEETDKKLVEFCYEIVPQMLSLSKFYSSMEVRMMALQCLQKCAKCPPHVILPLRQKVIDELEHSLDDRKRLVRNEGRLTRNIWILVGSPGGL